MPDSAIFFSYAREDSEFALRLARDLRDAGHAIWIDQLDIPAGVHWDHAVETALHEASTLLVILSPHSVESPNVLDEVSYAIEERRRVIPIFAAPCKIPFRLRRIQYVDFTGEYDVALQKALRDFKRRLSVPVTAMPDETAPTVEPAPTSGEQAVVGVTEQAVEEPVAPEPTIEEPVVEPPPLEPASLDPPPPEPTVQVPEPDPPRPPAVAPRALAAAARPRRTGWLKMIVAAGLLWAGVVLVAEYWDDWFGPDRGGSFEEATFPASQATTTSDGTPVAPSPPVAGFQVSSEIPERGTEVAFTNASTGEITSLSWSFGDGATSAEESPGHRFQRAGAFDVTLRATGPGGSHEYTRRLNVREPRAWAVQVAGERVGIAPFTTDLEANGSIPGGNFTWDFGDGTVASGPRVRHTFANPGTYTVTVRGTHQGGTATGSIQVSVRTPVRAAAPVAEFRGNAVSPHLPTDLRFSNQTTGTVTRYEWDFGDGSTSTEASPTHRFPRPGAYIVRLRAIGPGGTSEKTNRFNFMPAGTVTLLPTPTTGNAPFQVQLLAHAEVINARFLWFIDGVFVQEGNPIYRTLDSPGRYRVGVWMTAPTGQAASSTEIVVTAGPTVLDPATMANKWWKLRPRSRETECLEGYRETVGPARTMKCGGVAGQMWKVIPRGPDVFQLTTQWVESDGLCLEGNGPGPQALLGGASFMGRCGNFTGQLWKAFALGGGYYRLQSLGGIQERKCLDGNVDSPNAPFNGNLMQAACDGSTSQQWKLASPD